MFYAWQMIADVEKNGKFSINEKKTLKNGDRNEKNNIKPATKKKSEHIFLAHFCSGYKIQFRFIYKYLFNIFHFWFGLFPLKKTFFMFFY